MRQIFKFFALAGVMALLATSCYKGDIDSLQSQIDQLRSGEIATVNSQITAINTSINDLKAVDNTLKRYITELQKDGELYAKQIAELQKIDLKILDRIADLEDYIQYGIQSTKDWVSATFATLEQLDALSQVLAELNTKVDTMSDEIAKIKEDIKDGYKKSISDAVYVLERSMTAWVNEKFTHYYTIAQVDSKVNALALAHDTRDAELLQQINGLKNDIQTAKTEITTAYQAAITTAITTLQGQLNTKLANDIAAASQNLQNQINTINTEITGIKTRLDAIETNIENLVNRIQSIAVIPQYTDGSVLVTGGVDTIAFDVTPAYVADSIAKVWKGMTAAQRAAMVSFRISGVRTKSGDPEAFVDTVFFRDGEFNVGVRFSDLPENAVAALQIAFGASDAESQYFALSASAAPKPEDVFKDGAVTTMDLVDGTFQLLVSYKYHKAANNFECISIFEIDDTDTTDVTTAYKDYCPCIPDGKKFIFNFVNEGRLAFDSQNKVYSMFGYLKIDNYTLNRFEIDGVNIIDQLTLDSAAELEPINSFDDYAATFFVFDGSADFVCFLYNKSAGTFSAHHFFHEDTRFLSCTKGAGNTFVLSYASSGSVETGTLVYDADNNTIHRTGDTPSVAAIAVDYEEITSKMTEI